MNKNLAIRNSTAEFLIFQAQSKEDSIEVKYADENIWLSQKMIAKREDSYKEMQKNLEDLGYNE